MIAQGKLSRTASKRGLTLGGIALAALIGSVLMAPRAARAAGEPIRIGVIGEEEAVAGASLTRAAQMAAADINAHGGVDGRKIELFIEDDHSSAAEAARAFQRLAEQDKVAAIVATYTSEVALALQPWSARLKMPFITPGASSDVISQNVKDDYAKFKYSFDGTMNSTFIAESACDFAHDMLVGPLHMSSAAIMSEDAAWTKPLDAEYEKCLPKAGLKVVDHIRFNPDTTDFTPIYNKIEGLHPSVIMMGWSHVGVQPTVQWHSQEVPIPLAGQSSQATTSGFWKDTNGAAQGVLTMALAAPDSALSPKTIPFAEAYEKKYGDTPSYAGYCSYDMIHVIAEAVKRAGSTDPDKMVTALENTDHVGTIGRIKFYGKDAEFPHAVEYGPGLMTGVAIQWQNGKQLTVWPADKAKGKITFPSFVKLPETVAK